MRDSELTVVHRGMHCIMHCILHMQGWFWSTHCLGEVTVGRPWYCGERREVGEKRGCSKHTHKTVCTIIILTHRNRFICTAPMSVDDASVRLAARVTAGQGGKGMGAENIGLTRKASDRKGTLWLT